MPTSTASLTEFLLARIAEDETRARVKMGDLMSECACPPMAQPTGGPVVEVHSPDLAQAVRTLADCRARRQIVDELHFDGRSGDYVAPWCVECSDDENLVYLPCPTLRLLASPYADHPDYRQEWKP